MRCLVAFSAVGSLREEVKPRDFLVPDQVWDRTKGLFGLFVILGLEEGVRRGRRWENGAEGTQERQGE